MVENRGKFQCYFRGNQRKQAANPFNSASWFYCCVVALNLSSIVDHSADLNPLSVNFPLACASKHVFTRLFLSTSVHLHTSFDAESTFYCNEGVHIFWMENGKKKLLPKSKGQSIMISGFMCACHGLMSAEIDGITYKSHQYFDALDVLAVKILRKVCRKLARINSWSWITWKTMTCDI